LARETLVSSRSPPVKLTGLAGLKHIDSGPRYSVGAVSRLVAVFGLIFERKCVRYIRSYP